MCSYLQAQEVKGFSISNNSLQDITGKTYALIVGISKYQNPNIPSLQFADRDAVAFRNYLVASGVDSNNIILLTNEDATCFNVKFDFDDLCTNRTKEGDKVFFYFSGHGDVESRTVVKTGYLLPYDATDKVYSINGIEIKFLQDYSATLSSKGVKPFLIVDACHAGKLAGGREGVSLTASVFANKWKNETKFLSCQPGEISLENFSWGKGRGLFSYELINGMAGLADKNNDGKVSLYELNLYISEKVHDEASPIPQNPMLIGNVEEIISIVNKNYLQQINSS
jgi:uncharacterized caspase-like protein